jgi:hypothetical protein
MPKGRVEPRTVECRCCGHEFVTDRAGKAAFYCGSKECNLLRAEQKRTRGTTQRRATRERRSGLSRFEALTDPRVEPLVDEILVVARLAADIGANPRILKESIMAIAKGHGDLRFAYRRAAACCIALAAYVGGKRP